MVVGGMKKILERMEQKTGNIDWKEREEIKWMNMQL